MPRRGGATDTITISLPREMRKTVDQLRHQEHRTTSELFREALRVYASTRATPYTPTATERRAIEKGRRSQPMSIEDFFAHVERLGKTSRGQKRRPRTRKRA